VYERKTTKTFGSSKWRTQFFLYLTPNNTPFPPEKYLYIYIIDFSYDLRPMTGGLTF